LDLNGAAGLFNVKVESGGNAVGNFPIHVLWVNHTSQPQPFIRFRPTMMSATQLRDALQHLVDSEVSFTLTPLEAEAGQGKN
jgi:hypothetical protein